MTYNITRSLKLIALTLIGLTFAFSSASYAQAQVESNKPIVYIVHFPGDCAGDPIKTPETAKDMTFLECRNVCEGLKTSCSGFSFSVASKNANIVDTCEPKLLTRHCNAGERIANGNNYYSKLFPEDAVAAPAPAPAPVPAQAAPAVVPPVAPVDAAAPAADVTAPAADVAATAADVTAPAADITAPAADVTAPVTDVTDGLAPQDQATVAVEPQ